MRTLLCVTLIALMPAAVAAQSPEKGIATGGVGNLSCGSWTAARKELERSQGHAWGYEQWVLGYISGFAVGKFQPDTFNPLADTDFEGVWAWVDNYCQANPLKPISEAAVAFMRAHPHADTPN